MVSDIFEYIRNNDLESVKKLIESDNTLLEIGNYLSYTPLHIATFYGHIDIIKYLVECGADIETKDNDGNTPLYSSSYKGRLDVVKYLISVGVDIESKNNYDDTPLHIASVRYHIKIVEYLLSKGADPYIKNKYGDTTVDLYRDKEKILNLIRMVKLKQIYGK